MQSEVLEGENVCRKKITRRTIEACFLKDNSMQETN